MSTTSSTATTQAWNVPHARDPHFVGRDDVFARLWGRFSASSGPARVQGLCGLGGVGKTAIAAEYAYRYGPFYDTVWWVRAEAPSTLASDYAALAPHVGVTAGEDAAVDTVRDAVRRALDHRAGWLLIFDNVGRPEDVRPYLPTRGGGHVLVTSRTTDWAGVAHTTTLLGLSREEAVQLLRGRTNRAGTEEDAARVARVLGDLPLALEHAAASIAQSRGTFTGYLREYEAAWEQQLAERRAPGGYPPSVVITNDMAFRQARRTHPVAADLLTLCAFFAPEDIGLDWLSAAAGAAEPEALQRAAADPASLAGVAADLRRHGLAGGTSEALSVHRLVRDLTRSRLDHGEATRWRAAALRVAAAAFEFDRGLPSTWRRARAVLPHLLAAAGHASVADADPLATADAYNAAGAYLLFRADLTEARRAFERAVELYTSARGTDHPRVAAAANNLGIVLTRLGEFDQATALLRRTVEFDRSHFGEDDTRLATSLNNYGICLQSRGQHADALRQFTEAAAVYQWHQGSESAEFASVLNNLGHTLAVSGEAADARAHLVRAREIAESARGADHPDVARVLVNLATVVAADDPAEARELLQRALSIDEAAYGNGHPLVIEDLVRVGDLAVAQGDLEAARERFKAAFHAAQEALGPHAPMVELALRRIGAVRLRTGDHRGATICSERADYIRSRREDERRGPTGGGTRPTMAGSAA